MKAAVVLCALALVFCFIGEAKGEGCKPNTVTPGDDCTQLHCSADGILSVKGCAEARCAPGKENGFKEDKTKTYPECCPQPICKD